MGLYSNQTKTSSEYKGEHIPVTLHFTGDDYELPPMTPDEIDKSAVWFLAVAVVCLLVAVVA